MLALAQGRASARAALKRAYASGTDVVIPPVVVAETVRGDGPKDAPVNRVLKAVDAIPPTTERVARTAGALLGSTKSPATIDALVVAEAIERGAAVLTADRADMRRLAQRRVPVIVL